MKPNKYKLFLGIFLVSFLVSFLAENSGRAETLSEMYENAQQNPFGLKYSKKKSQEQVREENEYFRQHQENERRRQEKAQENFRQISNEEITYGQNCHTILVEEYGQFVKKKLCK